MLIALLKYFTLAPLSVLMTLLCVVFSPVIALFLRQDGYLPSWLAWFQTPDNPAIGDANFHANQMAWTHSPYLWCVFWLIRNPAYGFDAFAGFQAKGAGSYKAWGNEAICIDRLADGSYRLIQGWYLRRYADAGGTRFQLRFIFRWLPHRCARLSFGWVLWQPMPVGSVRNLELTISPFMAC